MAQSHFVHRAVFINFLLGGVAAAAGRTFRRLHDADDQPFLHSLVQIDTHEDESCPADARYVLKTSAQNMEALITNAARYGDDVVAIIREIAPYLRPSDILNGARTTRCLTQLLFAFHERALCRAIRNVISNLRNQARFKEVHPVLISSSGGGTGSALQILLMRAFADPAFRQKLLLGEDDFLLLPPLAFVVEPFHFAREVDDTQSHMILANAYAYRVETEWLLQQGIGPDYVFHLGFSNDEGAVIAGADLMGRTLGECVYQVERNWPEFKKHWVDNVDRNAHFNRYSGLDTAQRLHPELFAAIHSKVSRNGSPSQ